ncbi:MAG: acyltransferase [Patulibacter minatonensis]
MSSQAAKGAPRLEQLDAFRLIVVAVITFHTFQHSDNGGGLVLPPGTVIGSIVGNLDFLLAFYFMMAGFGLAVQLLRPVLEGRELPATGAFLAKRLVRLVPLYLIVFLLVWELRYAGTERQWQDLYWGVTLMQSWSTEHIFATIDPAWYLSVEIGFLLTAAFVLLPLLRRIARLEQARSRRRAVIGMAIGIILASTAWKQGLAAAHVDYDDWGRWFSPPSWMDLWGIGMLFGLGVMRFAQADRYAPRGMPLALVVASLSYLWVLVLLADNDHLPRTIRWICASVGILGLMVASLMAPPERIARRVMASKPVQTFGAASFGMFLVHAPILRYFSHLGLLPLHTTAQWAVSTVALTALSALVGTFTLRFIETPMLGLVRLHLPERARRWHEARRIKPKLRPGMPCPGLLEELYEPAGAPLVVLVAPASRLRPPSQRDPGMNALLELVANRFVIDAVGGKAVGLIGRDPIRVPRAVGGDSDAINLEIAGRPGADIVKMLGIGGHRLRNGLVVPDRVAIVVGADGTVAGVLQDDNGIDLARRAIDVALGAAVPPEGDDARLPVAA